ncbi:MAG: ShlB/FhaC/HecB family hemolysin secretion/activation protein [Verrucomicrobiae bacterium]|nr:ShlB/FhaC/HecB family hemolysin secretion/activation protein [Verrucomicrobiae bacterium]
MKFSLGPGVSRRWMQGFGVLAVGVAALSVSAQDFDRLKPKEPEARPGRVETPTEKPVSMAPDADKPLVAALRGALFVASPAEVKKAGAPVFDGIRTEKLGLLEMESFQAVARAHLGKPVSRASLNAMVREVIQHYRKCDRPVVDVVVPEQDITNGVVQLVVLEGHVGQVRVEENRWFSTKRIAEQVRLRPGDPISERALKDDVDWLNTNPFRTVDAVFTPGKDRGQTDVVLKAKDRFPVRFYTGYEDTGNDLTGDERWLAGFNWGNAFDLDHQLNYQFTTSSDFKKLTGHSGSWVIPLPWRHRLTFFGSRADTVGDVAPPLNLKGFSWQTSVRYAAPLPAPAWLTHEASAGFDFKQSNNNLEFGGAQIYGTTTDVDQFVFDYTATARDAYGATSLTGEFVYSPGGWTPRNFDQNFVAARAGALAEYRYGKASLERVTQLPWDFSWMAKGAFQVAHGNLLASEQFGVGGFSSVRGYDEREANGDEGYLVSTEIRTPPVSLGAGVGLDSAVDQLQFLGFFDYGAAENRRLLPGEDPHVQLASAGPGVRYAIAPWLSVRFDYGWQLYDTGLNPRYNSRGHLGVVIAY